MQKQYPLTMIANVLPHRHKGLYRFLRDIHDDLEAGKHEVFEDLGNIHYLRWVVIDDGSVDGTDASGKDAKLVLSTNFDGPVENHMRDLASKAAELMDKIYDACEGYPAAGERNDESRYAFIKERSIPVSAFYVGAPGRTLPQIRQENELRNHIRQLLDAGEWQGMSAQQIHRQIRQEVLSNSAFDWVSTPYKSPGINWPGMVLLGLILLVLLPVIVLWVLMVQFFYERKDTYFTLKRSQLDEAKIKRLETYEDWHAQNQFTQLVVMKPGKVRLITFNALMLFAKALISFIFVRGKLMGIPTIHFARWVLFDDKKRVLFFSNFDGSWQQYLGDFIDQSGWGLTGIFSNTTNFPKTKFLFTGGAYDEEHFLAWSRNTELPTQIWYNAYPNLSIKNVNNNTFIRANLIKDLSEKKARRFLQSI